MTDVEVLSVIVNEIVRIVLSPSTYVDAFVRETWRYGRALLFSI